VLPEPDPQYTAIERGRSALEAWGTVTEVTV